MSLIHQKGSQPLSASTETLPGSGSAGSTTGVVSVRRSAGERLRDAWASESWQSWLDAGKQVLPTYLAIRIAMLFLTYLAPLFTIPNYSGKTYALGYLVQIWKRWDTLRFLAIIDHGYQSLEYTAFFPLYPLLARGLKYIVQSSLLSALIISNVATFLLFVVMYQLIRKDFDKETAFRTVLYMSVFPTGLFLVTAYNESLFLLFAMLSFYAMRKGGWWLAGTFGLFACLTRSSGAILVFPFLYEYARQHNYRIRDFFRPGFFAVGLIPVGVLIFAVYCYWRFGDALAFSHAQKSWGREFHLPWETFVMATKVIISHRFVSFQTMHALIDFGSALYILFWLVLGFVGPYRISKDKWIYLAYAVILYIFLFSFPAPSTPVQSMARQMIEIFPAFIVLANFSKNKGNFHLYYTMVMMSLLAFLMLQFLNRFWVV